MKEFNRRQHTLVLLGALIVMLGGLLPACGGGAAPASTVTVTATRTITPSPSPTPAALTPAPAPTSTPAPKPTGNLVIAITLTGADIWDPLIAGVNAKPMLELLYHPLVGVDAKSAKTSQETGIAYKWDVSADSTVWTFYLRKGIKFHDGTELTAEDVKFSLDRERSKEAITVQASFFRAVIKDVKVDDPYRVTVTLTEPTFFFDYTLSPLMGVEGFIVPKQYIEAHGVESFRKQPVGTGPYRFAEWAAGSYVRFEAVDTDPLVGVPRYKEVIFRGIPEEGTRIAGLQTGELSVIEVSQRQGKGLAEKGFKILQQKNAASIGITFGPLYKDPKSPLNDPRVREALGLAINKEQIVSIILGGYGRVSGDFLSTPLDIAYKENPPIQYDVDKAKRLLAQAGYANWPKDYELLLYATQLAGMNMWDMAEVVASQWREIGVKAKFIQVEYGVFRKRWVGGGLTPNEFLLSSPPPRPMPVSIFTGYFAAGGSFDGIKSTEVAAYVKEILQSSGNKDLYIDVSQKMYRFIYDNYWALPIASAAAIYAAVPTIPPTWEMGMVPLSMNILDAVKR